MDRIVLDIHGVGPKPPWVAGTDEDFYWCDHREVFHRILAEIPESKIEVELTFDDGNASDLSIVLPALIKQGLKASFFVCAGRIGQPGYLDGAGLKDIIAAGMSIGSHGWAHIDWRKTDDAELDQEVNAARKKIEDTTSTSVDSVAIPFGGYNRRIMNALNVYKTIYNSDGALASSTARIRPRWSYQKDWTASGNLARLATIGSGRVFRAKSVLRMAFKRSL